MEKVFDLRLFRKANGITQLAVAEYLGVTKQMITQIETGKTPMPTDKLKRILDNPEWSIAEYHKLVETIEDLKAGGKGRKAEVVAAGEGDALIRVPLLPIFAQAGHLTGWSEGVMETECERVISPVKDIDMAVHIYGESMYPDIPNGSVVYVKRVTNILQWGQAFILDTKEGPLLKYLAPGTDEEHIKCISANHDPKYAPFEVCKEDILGIYRVVMCMKMM